jgi:ribosomal protein L37E
VACAACGASLEADLAGACADGLATAPVAAPAPATPPLGAASPSEEHRLCSWCGERSPATAEQCVTCGAVFPRPEQDAALLRAAEARLQAANDTLAMMQRQRARRGLRRFFNR